MSGSAWSGMPSLSRSPQWWGSLGKASSVLLWPSPSKSLSELSPTPSLSKSAHSLELFGKMSSSLGTPSWSRSGSSSSGMPSPSMSAMTSSIFSSAFVMLSGGINPCSSKNLQYSGSISPSSPHCSLASLMNFEQIPFPVEPFLQMTPKNSRHFSCSQMLVRFQHMSARMTMILRIKGFSLLSAASSFFSHFSFISSRCSSTCSLCSSFDGGPSGSSRRPRPRCTPLATNSDLPTSSAGGAAGGGLGLARSRRCTKEASAKSRAPTNTTSFQASAMCEGTTLQACKRERLRRGVAAVRSFMA
mmetsp:Transcript_97346/g.245649  ORF Transcript_97346/g.245649 Transcript_97346/m.245649 type:complete len:302 (-) Transcript_97346:6-911(-)